MTNLLIFLPVLITFIFIRLIYKCIFNVNILLTYLKLAEFLKLVSVFSNARRFGDLPGGRPLGVKAKDAVL